MISLIALFALAQPFPTIESADAGAVDAAIADAGSGGEGADVDAGVDADGGRLEAFTEDGGLLVAVAEAPAAAPADGGVPELKLPKGFIGLKGRVTDSRTGEGLIEATIKVVVGAKKSALTDLDGNYRLRLPPGTYELRVFYELYQGRRIQNVEIKEGKVTTLDVSLESDSRSVQEVVVEAKIDKRNESALLQERKRAAVVQDSVGAQEIARTPDSSAGDAAKRVVSVTLVDNKFVFIRGLGGRYAGTLLNRTVLPSPEPDEPSVPLDLFPTALVSNLNVVKTYTPELPGQFGGGSLTIDTSTFPSEFELRLRAQVGADTVTTFRDRPSAPSTVGEAFGFRDGSRDLPAAIPTDRPLQSGNDPAKSVDPARQQEAGRSFTNRWTPGSVLASPNGTFGAQIGNTFKFGKESRFGVLAALQWSRREQTRRISSADVSGSDTGLKAENQTESTLSSVNASSSALVNMGLQINRDNEVNFLALALTNAELEALQASGQETISANQFQTSSRISLTQRVLSFNQLKGFHRIGGLGELEIDWQANFATVSRVAPDIRDLATQRDETTLQDIVRVGNPNSSERFFLTLGEDSGGGNLNLSLPYRNFRFKIGGMGQYQARQFNGRRFRYFRVSGPAQPGAPEQLFVDENIGPGPGTRYLVSETTLAADSYTASLLIYAGYGLVEWKPAEWVRGQIGVRYEGSTQNVVTGSPFGAVTNIEPISRTYNNPLPSINLTFSPSATVNLRAAYALTLARPSFRELAPFVFYDQVRRRNVSGNRELLQSDIHHGDLRAEWFPNESEVFAASVFGKQFIRPIERVVIGTSLTSDFGFRNADGAQMLGFEVEARTSLGRLTPVLKDFRIGGNAAFIWSQIQISPNSSQLGRGDRPLQGQSPWVGNAFLTYTFEKSKTELGVFYNVYGPRITEVAALPLPDFYEQPFHKLDFTFSQGFGPGFQVKLTVANMLNQSIRIQQGDIEVYRYAPGVQFNASLAWAMPTAGRK